MYSSSPDGEGNYTCPLSLCYPSSLIRGLFPGWKFGPLGAGMYPCPQRQNTGCQRKTGGTGDRTWVYLRLGVQGLRLLVCFSVPPYVYFPSYYTVSFSLLLLVDLYLSSN